ncbi:MAG: hypothetical protein HDR85_08495 [Bacteroides sp.]|nr:hypothetical protein [Bacteroides sp.]MBD5354924.1 hypothetical protein [Bacteroides sp.]
MARVLQEKFFKWLQTDQYGLLKTISQYDCLSIQFSESENSNSELKVYFKGCLILTISDKIVDNDKLTFEELADSYYKKEPNANRITEIVNKGVSISNLEEYLDCVIGFLSRRNNDGSEKDIRQRITYVNNRGPEATSTDYFVIAEEYQIENESRFDLVTLRWRSDGNIRKNFSSKQSDLEIVIFELKRGIKAIKDLKKHSTDFMNLISNDEKVSKFKLDIIKMFVQQASLKGFFNTEIKCMKYVELLSTTEREKEIEDIATKIPVKFGIIISDYNQDSTGLKEEIEKIQDDFLFARSSFMGYGLYKESMGNRQDLLRILNEHHNS